MTLARALGIGVIVVLIAGTLGVAQPGGIQDPDAGVGPLQPGSDTLTFSGVPASLSRLKFVAEGYRIIAQLRPGPATLQLLDSNWTRTAGRMPALEMRGVGPASIKLRVPDNAAGVVFTYTVLDGLFAPLDVSLNGSKVSLQPVHQPYECLIRVKQAGGKARLDGEPILNMWAMRGSPPGPVFDETHCELDLSPGNDPLSCGEYRLHVSYVADPRRVSNPSAPTRAKLRGFDVTQYDGYVVTVKADDARRFSASLKDSTNFSWRGAGSSLTPGEWCSLAIPFELHTNYTTAGDGVLKLAELDHVNIGVGGRSRDAGVTGEYWVRPPVFYTGDPPEGVPVAEKSPPNICAVTSLSPERRKPHYYEGVAIQAIHQQGDAIWLGTDRGLIKCLPSKPGVPMAKYGMAEGLVDDDVQAVYSDGDDLWVGTTCGMSRFDGEHFQNYTSDHGLLPGPVLAITSNDDSLWFGMARGIAKLDKSSGEITARKGKGGWAPESTGGQGVPVQEGRGVYCDSIAVDSDGTLWHGAAGMTHSNDKGRRLSHFGGTTRRVLAMYPVGDNVWCVSARGITLHSKDATDTPLKNFGIARRRGIGGERHNAFITCAYPQRDGIWLGYSDGIGWFSLRDQTCHWSPTYSVQMGSLVAQCLFADDRNVWVGTDNGLMVFPKSEKTKPWDVLDYNAPTDLWAAGVYLDTEADLTLGCEEGCADELPGVAQNVTLDETVGAPDSPGALRLDFALDKDADSEAVLSQRFNLELDDCRGVSFCAKTDGDYRGKPREFFVDVTVSATVGKRGNRRREVTLRQVVQLDTKWRQFNLPFAKMRMIAGAGGGRAPIPQAIHLTGVHVGRSVGDFHCPGDTGTLWLDKLQLLNGGSQTAKPTPRPKPKSNKRGRRPGQRRA